MQYYGNRPQRRRPNTHRKWIFLAAFIMSLIIAALVAYWATAGNSGQITPLPPTEKVVTITDKQLNNKYISFTYSGHYTAQNENPKAPVLETYMLTADTDYSKHLAVYVLPIPDGNLKANSDYNYRESALNLYTSSKQTVDNSIATIFVKNDNTEETVYIQKGNIVAELSFSTAGNDDHLQPEVADLLNTFKWK